MECIRAMQQQPSINDPGRERAERVDVIKVGMFEEYNLRH